MRIGSKKKKTNFKFTQAYFVSIIINQLIQISQYIYSEQSIL